MNKYYDLSEEEDYGNLNENHFLTCNPAIVSPEERKPIKLDLSDKDIADIKAGRKIVKTDGFCNELLVDHPDRYKYDENGRKRTLKRRNGRGTNMTPPKKKRK